MEAVTKTKTKHWSKKALAYNISICQSMADVKALRWRACIVRPLIYILPYDGRHWVHVHISPWSELVRPTRAGSSTSQPLTVNCKHSYSYKRLWSVPVYNPRHHRSHFKGYGAYPHFWSEGTVPAIFTSCHSCGTTRLLQCSADSLARFVDEERARKRAKEWKWRKQGRGRQMWYSLLFSPKWR